jgi:estrone sulfotransferase
MPEWRDIVSIYHRLKKEFSEARLRKTFMHSLRESDIFIVTYPRSGTTWLGFMLANLLKGKTDELLTLRESSFGKYVPTVGPEPKGNVVSKFAMLPDPRYFRTHSLFNASFPNVIYLLRDPRDVMVSYFHFCKLTNPDFNLAMKEFIIREDFMICGWDVHVSGWLLENTPKSLLMVKYEEILSDAVTVLRKIADYSKLECQESDLIRVSSASEFGKMRSLENKFGVDRVKDYSEKFIRRGESGVWRDELDEECLETIEKKFGSVMKCVGYELCSC